VKRALLCAVLFVNLAAQANPSFASPFGDMKGGQGGISPRRPQTSQEIRSHHFPFTVRYSKHVAREEANAAVFFIDNAWRFQVNRQGFSAPQNYTVYLAPTLSGGALTRRDEQGVYTILDPSMALELWRSYLAHEFQHACQFAMGGPSSSVFIDEASAVYQEVAMLGQEAPWLDALHDFQQWPNAPLFTTGAAWRKVAGVDLKYEYGAALFMLYLVDNFDDDKGVLMRNLWERKEPWIKSIEALTQRSMADLLLDFSIWRLGVGPHASSHWGPMDGASFGALGLVKTFRVSDVTRKEPLRLLPSQMPHQLGCFVLEHQAGLYTQPFAIDVKSLAAKPLGLAYAVLAINGEVNTGKYPSQAQTLVQKFTLKQDQTLFVTICDLQTDLAFAPPQAHPIEVKFVRL
jgi:hypothetical protein